MELMVPQNSSCHELIVARVTRVTDPENDISRGTQAQFSFGHIFNLSEYLRVQSMLIFIFVFVFVYVFLFYL